MRQYLIGAAIRRSNRRLLVSNFLLLICITCLSVGSSRYLANFVHGPVTIHSDTLTTTRNPATLLQYWVTISGQRAFPFGQKTKTHNGVSRVTDSYSILQVGSHFLLVRSAGNRGMVEKLVTGSLVPIPSGVQSGMLDGVFARQPFVRQRMYPYMLDTDNFRGAGYFSLAVGFPLFILGMLNVERARKRLEKFALHPDAKALEAYGEPEAVARNIDAEALTQGSKVGTVLMTPTWLLHHRKKHLDIIRLSDIVWIYRREAQRITGGIPSGKFYSAVFCDRNGKCVTATASPGEVDAMLQAVALRLPHVLVGFDPNVAEAYHTNRASVIAAVNARRKAPAIAASFLTRDTFESAAARLRASSLA